MQERQQYLSFVPTSDWQVPFSSSSMARIRREEGRCEDDVRDDEAAEQEPRPHLATVVLRADRRCEERDHRNRIVLGAQNPAPDPTDGTPCHEKRR